MNRDFVNGDEMSETEKRAGRPRKYASASERQAAYRARASELTFRSDRVTAATLDGIASALDVSRSDLLLSMVKFALTNHDWARFGLTHKTLPKYKGNPIMATKAQIAARARFAEMARSGAFRRTPAKASAKASVTRRAANPRPKKAPHAPFYYVVKVGSHYDGQFLSSHYTLEQVKAIAQAKADKYGATARITELHR